MEKIKKLVSGGMLVREVRVHMLTEHQDCWKGSLWLTELTKQKQKIVIVSAMDNTG